MPHTIKGPAIFLLQYVSDEAPFNSLDSIARWAHLLGYKGIQVPVDERLIDIDRAAEDEQYCQDIVKQLADIGVEITELSTHLQGQLIAVHPAYDQMFDGFAHPSVRGNPEKRRLWAHDILIKSAKASKNLGLKAHATFSGALAWPYIYPWPQRPGNLIETAFKELANRWVPILDEFDRAGVDVCYEIHPGEDLHDGTSFERFLEVTNHHPRACILFDPSHLVLQQLDYLAYLDHYHKYIKIFHVKDAEFRSDGKQGVYGGYSGWRDRAGTFRALGDGQVDFKAVFSKLARYEYPGWAVLESECAYKDLETCAKEGVERIRSYIIPVADASFDDFAGGRGASDGELRSILGI